MLAATAIGTIAGVTASADRLSFQERTATLDSARSVLENPPGLNERFNIVCSPPACLRCLLEQCRAD